MKKSFDESIQWMREQNWIKSWLNTIGYSSLDDTYLLEKMRSRYNVMERNNVGTSIVLGVRSCIFERYAGIQYARSIRTAMHKWMFNY